MTAKLTLRGHVPGKKNMYRRAKNGRLYLDELAAGEIGILTAQAMNQWGREPAVHPVLQVQFFVRDKRGDRDNKLVTVMDCLRNAGVIQNDNIARFNGTLTMLPAVVDPEERVVVEIEYEAGDPARRRIK